MDERSQKRFNEIVAKDPSVLTTEEIAFLRARSSYLKKIQLEEYDSILNPKVISQTSKKETVKPHDRQSK